jgi:hypothetical protein
VLDCPNLFEIFNCFAKVVANYVASDATQQLQQQQQQLYKQ